MINPKLPRYVTASVAQLLKAQVEALDLTFFVEGVDVEASEWFQTDSAVLRVVGPTYYPGSGIDRYKFEVMVMVTDLLSGGQNGFLNHDRIGTIANVLCSPIPVFAYTDGDAQVGCLDIDPDAREYLRIVPFGKLDPDTEVVQAAVIANYEICLDA